MEGQIRSAWQLDELAAWKSVNPQINPANAKTPILYLVSLDTPHFVYGTDYDVVLCSAEGVKLDTIRTEGRTISLCPVTGGRVLVGGAYSPICLFSTDTGTFVTERTFEGAMTEVTFLCLLSEEKFMSGEDNGRIRIWNIETGKEVTDSFSGHGGSIFAAAKLPGDRFATSGCDDELKVWDSNTYEQLQSIALGWSPLCITPLTDGSIALGDVQGIFVYSSDFTKMKEKPFDPTFTIVELFPGTLAFLFNATLATWDLETDKITELAQRRHVGVYSMSLLTNDNLIVSDSNGCLVLYAFLEIKWRRRFRQLFVARSDPDSIISSLPVEVIYQIVALGFFD